MQNKIDQKHRTMVCDFWSQHHCLHCKQAIKAVTKIILRHVLNVIKIDTKMVSKFNLDNKKRS